MRSNLSVLTQTVHQISLNNKRLPGFLMPETDFLTKLMTKRFGENCSPSLTMYKEECRGTQG